MRSHDWRLPLQIRGLNSNDSIPQLKLGRLLVKTEPFAFASSSPMTLTIPHQVRDDGAGGCQVTSYFFKRILESCLFAVPLV